MKRAKAVITLISIVLTAALLLTSLALAQNEGSRSSEVRNESSVQTSEDLLAQANDSENVTGVTRHVIEGSFNVTENGDVIENLGTTEEHWKNVTVPQLTLDDMPLIKVYYRPNNSSAATHEMWRESTEALDTFPTLSVVYDEQTVVILYKKIYTDSGVTNYLFNGEYKIVVIK